MSNWPFIVPGGIVANAVNANASRGVNLTLPVAVNSKSAWTELFAATPRDASAICLQVSPGAGDVLLDIGLGAAALEVVAVPDMFVGFARFNANQVEAILPISMPEGARVAVRYQSSAISTVARVSAQLIEYGFPGLPPSGIVALGVSAADSGGTHVDPGAAANTKGAWSEIVAATADDLVGLIVLIGQQSNEIVTGGDWLIDIGIGPASTELVIAPDLTMHTGVASDIFLPQRFGPLPASIPAGTRIAARAQSNITDPIDRLFDIALLGLVR